MPHGRQMMKSTGRGEPHASPISGSDRRALWRWLLLSVGLAVLWTSACVIGGQECKSSADCGGAQICVANACTYPPVGEQTKEPTQEPVSTEQPAEPKAEPPSEPTVEPTNEPTAEPSVEPSTDADAGPQPDDDPLPDAPTDSDPGPCIDGHTRPCYNGPTSTQDQGECTTGTQSCQGGVWDPECKGEVLPSIEVCDGKDNDCDGDVDEDFSGKDSDCAVPNQLGPCAQGKLACQNGQPVCVSGYQSQPEDCSNQIDDDCDGLVDGPPCTCNSGESRECYTGHPPSTANVGACLKGKQDCGSDGKWGKCTGEITPTQEVCDGEDNNCDGQLDETFPEKGKACSDKSKKGECQRGVYTACQQGKLVCTSQVKPVTEICENGKDDDCDGDIDDNPPCVCKSGQSRSCYSGAPGTDRNQPCKRGSQVCGSNNQWGACKGEVIPKKETCDNTDEDCNGQIDDNLQRLCSTTCGKGTETCKLGKWVNCTAPKPLSERCDNKDNDCDGKVDESLTQSCSNQCGTGTETCSAGKWVNCSAPKAGTEVCDGKDNDCDGQTDEGNPGGGRSCSIVGAKGECAKGQITCLNAKLTCRALYKAVTEKCDGKDNDCDGSVDESDPQIGQACTLTANKGECRKGTYACSNARLYCRQSILARTEICRDGKDNDCDGSVDEICGNTYVYGVISSAGTFTAQRSLKSVSKIATGTYRITTSSTSHGCDRRPMFVTPNSSSMRPVSVGCSGSSFDVRIAGHAPRAVPSPLADRAHTVAIPFATSGAAYGYSTCPSAAGSTCTVLRSYGSPKVTKYGTGIYDIAFSGCNSVTQPVFATIYGTYTSGYAVGYYLSSGKCRVRTYDLNGQLTNRAFNFWIPNRTRAAYAIISSTGSVYASNYFGDSRARWTGKRIDNTSGTLSRYEVRFPAWNSKTGIIGNVRQGSPYHAAFVTTSGGTNVYTRSISDAKINPIYFSVLFIQ